MLQESLAALAPPEVGEGSKTKGDERRDHFFVNLIHPDHGVADCRFTSCTWFTTLGRCDGSLKPGVRWSKVRMFLVWWL